MSRWDVDIAKHDQDGEREHEPLGTFGPEDLPAVLAEAFRRAADLGAGAPTIDGAGVVWFQDETGDESGRWFVQPFDGGPSRPFVEGLPLGWNEGLAQARGVTVVVVSDRAGFHVYASIEGEPARAIRESSQSITLGEAEFAFRGFDRSGLSADGSLLCLQHAEHGDLIHQALVVVNPATGETVGEQLDPGMSLRAFAWSPVAGDQRLAIS